MAGYIQVPRCAATCNSIATISFCMSFSAWLIFCLMVCSRNRTSSSCISKIRRPLINRSSTSRDASAIESANRSTSCLMSWIAGASSTADSSLVPEIGSSAPVNAGVHANRAARTKIFISSVCRRQTRSHAIKREKTTAKLSVWLLSSYRLGTRSDFQRSPDTVQLHSLHRLLSGCACGQLASNVSAAVLWPQWQTRSPEWL